MKDCYTVIAQVDDWTDRCRNYHKPEFDFYVIEDFDKLIECLAEFKFYDKRLDYEYGISTIKFNITVLVNGREDPDNLEVAKAYEKVPAVVEEKLCKYMERIEKQKAAADLEREAERLEQYKKLKAEFEGEDI